MNSQRYDEVAGELMAEAEAIEEAKRPGYTQGDADVLKNFRSVGARVKSVCPDCGKAHSIGEGAAWGVYAMKHMDAILSIVTQPDLPVSEAPIGRFSDLINYTRLGFAIVKDRGL